MRCICRVIYSEVAKRLILGSITDAEALQDSGDYQTQRDRDELAKPEGMRHKNTSAPAMAAAKLAARNEGIVGTPDGEQSDFDWDETDSSDEEEVEAVKRAKEEVEADRHRLNVKRAKRLRKVYIACMKLSRPVRTALIALIGGGILITPAIVVWTAYANDRSSTVVRDNVKVWSLWLMILWTCTPHAQQAHCRRLISHCSCLRYKHICRCNTFHCVEDLYSAHWSISSAC